MRALLISTRLLGQTLGLRLAREASGRHAAAATILELRLALARAEHELAWLTARLARVSPRHRPHYTPLNAGSGSNTSTCTAGVWTTPRAARW